MIRQNDGIVNGYFLANARFTDVTELIAGFLYG